MTLDERHSRHHDTPRAGGDSVDSASYARERARIQADTRARAEREARLDRVDAANIYWG